MINANELRKGNLVDFNGEVAKVSQLLELEVVFKCGDSELFENLKGISLTEEWLKRFGFEKAGEGYYEFPYTKNVCVYVGSSFDVDFSYFSVAGDYDGCVHFEMPKYVHQLQNLYFVLTGKELSYE